MAVTYTREQRRRAKDEGLHLVTVAVTGITFQGPVSEEENRRLTEYLNAFFERRYRRATLTPTASAAPMHRPSNS